MKAFSALFFSAAILLTGCKAQVATPEAIKADHIMAITEASAPGMVVAMI